MADDITFDEFARKTLERADKLIRAVGIKTFSSVIRDTPVGDPDLWKRGKADSKGRKKAPAGYVGGRLRGNWRCSLAMADVSTFEAPGGAKTRKAYKNFPDLGQVLNEVNDTCNNADRKKVLWLSNSLPYAYRIEYEGWSRQAPEGMVRRNVTRIKKIISGELNKLKA